MTEIDRKRLRELCAKATEGPWEWVNGKTDEAWRSGDLWASLRTVEQFPMQYTPGKIPKFIADVDTFHDNAEANAAFIAAARTAVPALLDALESAEGRIGELERQLAEAREANMDMLPKAALDIIVERKRQIEAEGWTPAHDAAHRNGELAGAAACYIMNNLDIGDTQLGRNTKRMCEDLWPWARSWWKPSSRRRDLIKAGALIVAEIERLDSILARAEVKGDE